MKTILLLEQDATTKTPLTALLRAKGYQVIGASNGAAMQTILETGAPVDIVISCLPTTDADHLASVRKRNPALPVLFVTSPSDREHEQPEQAETGIALQRSCPRRGQGDKAFMQDIGRKIRIALHASSGARQSCARMHKSAYLR